MKKFINEEMFEIIQYLGNELKTDNEISIEVLNPNIKDNVYAGEKIKIEDKEFIYRSYKSWSDLAEILFCKMLVIHLYENTVILKFQKLNKLDFFIMI